MSTSVPNAEAVVAELNIDLPESGRFNVNPFATGVDYGKVPIHGVAPHPVEGWGWIRRVSKFGWTEGFDTYGEAQT